MNILYNKKVEHTDVYTFKINSGGSLHLKPGIYYHHNSPPDVEITFVNEKLNNVVVNDIKDLRTKWHVMGAVAEQIKKIEESYE